MHDTCDSDAASLTGHLLPVLEAAVVSRGAEVKLSRGVALCKEAVESIENGDDISDCTISAMLAAFTDCSGLKVDHAAAENIMAIINHMSAMHAIEKPTCELAVHLLDLTLAGEASGAASPTGGDTKASPMSVWGQESHSA